MRILAITHLFPNNASRYAGIFAARQFAALSRCGADVQVVYATIKVPRVLGLFRKKWKDYDKNHKPESLDGLNVSRVSYVRIEKGEWSCRWEGLALFYAMKKWAVAMHRRQPFDFIYGRGLFPCADTAARLSQYLNIPAIGAAIGGDVNLVPQRSRTLYRHYGSLMDRLDGIVANGQGLAEKIYAATHQKAFVLEGVVDPELFYPPGNKFKVRSELKLETQTQILLFVGNVIKEKGLYELLEAFAVARQSVPALQLKICGRGPETAGLQKKINELKMTGCVELVGAVAPEKVPAWMQASDIFAFPSYREGMPNAVMEAMTCGLPVIATAVGGLPAALGQCQGAILVEPKNIEQLTGAILKVAGDTTLRDRMGKHARETAVQRFGADTNALKLFNYFETVIDQYKKTHG
jgi:teichuronic acid biosynthesis glycosyltransferase TuaC